MASIKKMGDGSYKITVSLGYDVYGKKIRRYTTWVPDKEYTPRQLEKEVTRQATLFEEACKTGQITQGGGIKLVDFIPQWIENISVSATETTVEKYQYICFSRSRTATQSPLTAEHNLTAPCISESAGTGCCFFVGRL